MNHTDPKELYKPGSRLSKYMHHSVFEDIKDLAKEKNAINMAQGYPDWQPPSFVKDSLQEAAQADENQYTRVGGHPKLVKAISEEYGPKLGREIDSMEEITIANGAVGVLNNFFFAFLEEGDEVIVFEPTYPFMHPMVDLYHGKVRFASLEHPKGDSNDWAFNYEELEKLFNDKTRAIILNTPHNPTGKAIKRSEYERIMEILYKWPKVIVLADELYEHVMYDNIEHVRIASLPGMWDRTVSVYSGGKIFSVTGWRIGWGIGPSHLIKPMVAAQTWTTFSINTPAQAAIAEALTIAGSEGSGEGHATFYETLKETFQKKKDRLMELLKNGKFGYKVINPEGGYFIIVDVTESIPKIPIKYFYEEGKSEENKPVKNYADLENPQFTPDHAFVRWLIYEYGVATVPLYPFYEPSRNGPKNQRGATFIRFTICKEDDVIETVGERIAKH